MLSPMFNSDLRDWQDKHNEGGDFIVFSDVLWLDPLPRQGGSILRMIFIH